MLVRALFLGVLTSSDATDPSCDTLDEVSLLQAKVQGHLGQSQTEVGPSILFESVHGIAKRLKHGAHDSEIPSMTAATEAVNSALATLEPALEEEHARDQQQIDAQVGEMQACHTSGAHGTSVTDALAAELSTMRQCTADQTAAAATRDRECAEWTSHAARLVFPPTNMQSDSPETRYEISLGMKNWVEDNWDTIESERSECNEASTLAAEEASRCSPIIADYDERFCQHSQACSLQRSCHLHEVEVYDTLSDDARMAMSARLARYTTIQHVRCVLGLVVTALNTNTTIDDSSLESCEGDDVTGNVDHLTLNFPSPPPEPECPATQHDDPQCSEVDLPLAWTGGAADEADEEESFVIFDDVDPRLTISPGSILAPYGHTVQPYYSQSASATRLITSDDGICGISFRCQPKVEAMVGFWLQTSGRITERGDLDFAIRCRSPPTERPVIWEHQRYRYFRPAPTMADTDGTEIRITQQGYVEYLMGGAAYTGHVQITYPFRVAFGIEQRNNEDEELAISDFKYLYDC